MLSILQLACGTYEIVESLGVWFWQKYLKNVWSRALFQQFALAPGTLLLLLWANRKR